MNLDDYCATVRLYLAMDELDDYCKRMCAFNFERRIPAFTASREISRALLLEGVSA